MWYENAGLVRQMRSMEIDEVVLTISKVSTQELYGDPSADDSAELSMLLGEERFRDLVEQIDLAIENSSPAAEQFQLLHFILWFVQEVNNQNHASGPWFAGVSYPGDDRGSMGARLAVAFVRAYRHQFREIYYLESMRGS